MRLRPSRLWLHAAGVSAVLAVVAGTLGDAALASGASAGASHLIGNSIPQGSDPSLKIQAKALRADAKKFGLDVIEADANLDLNKQIADVDTFLQKKVGVLTIWPMDSRGIQPALARARKAGVRVITQQTPNGQNRDVNLQADDFGSGVRAAKYLGARLGRGSKVAAVFGPQQVDSFRDLAQGFLQGAKQAGLVVVDKQTNNDLTPEASATFVRNWKQQYGAALKGIFDSLDATAFADIAVRGGSFKPLIVTYGGSDEALQAVRRGDFAALAYQYTVVAGRASAWIANKLVKGQKLAGNIYLPQPLVTSANIAQFRPSGDQIRSRMTFALAKQGGRTVLRVQR
jgi:ribose transport system substrate-binding protein